MGIEDVIPDVREAIERFESEETEPTKKSAVYVLYHSETQDPMYVGQTENLYQRINDHHHPYNDTDLRKRIEDDPELDIETKGGDLWNQTEIRWIDVDGDRYKRERIERALEERLDPYFSSE